MLLTDKESKVLAFLEKYLKEHGYPPTVREICNEIGCSSTSTGKRYLDMLEDKQYIARDKAKPRAVEILIGTDGRKKERVEIIESRMLPEIGDTAAGLPITAIEHCNAYVAVPSEDFGSRDTFVLRVHGNSMVNAGIRDGDKIVCEKSSIAKNGDIVVALLGECATVKRFYKENHFIRLQPENDEMEPIIVESEAELAIQGIVTGVIHMLR